MFRAQIQSAGAFEQPDAALQQFVDLVPALDTWRARRVVVANLVIAASIIATLVAWDLAGHLPLPLGVLGHEGSTVIVGLNGLSLLRRSVWNRAMRTGTLQARKAATSRSL